MGDCIFDISQILTVRPAISSSPPDRQCSFATDIVCDTSKIPHRYISIRPSKDSSITELKTAQDALLNIASKLPKMTIPNASDEPKIPSNSTVTASAMSSEEHVAKRNRMQNTHAMLRTWLDSTEHDLKHIRSQLDDFRKRRRGLEGELRLQDLDTENDLARTFQSIQT